MKDILIIVILFLCGCNLKNQNNSYETSCISFEHTGEADGFYPSTIISTSNNWCGITIDSYQDTAFANLQMVDKVIYDVVKRFIINNEISYDMKYIRNEVSCSGYGVRLIENSSMKKKYVILKKEDYKNFFDKLFETLSEKDNTAELIESMKASIPERLFYCRDLKF